MNILFLSEKPTILCATCVLPQLVVSIRLRHTWNITKSTFVLISSLDN